MTKNEITRELNTLRLVLNDLTGESEIGEHYIDVLGKAMFLVGSHKWDFNGEFFDVKCRELAGDVTVEVYYKDTLLDEHSYKLDSIISEEETGEA
tara:strand:+ start:274 stop:558 length:285 start_codon:yes stop_codon:yes gene_type:complete